MEMPGKVDAIMELSNQMKPKAKAIARLSLIFGYTITAIAAMLDVRYQRVENSLSYFRKLLQEKCE